MGDDEMTIAVRLSQQGPRGATRRQAQVMLEKLEEQADERADGQAGAAEILLDLEGAALTFFFLDDLLAGMDRLARARGIGLTVTGSNQHSAGIVDHILRNRGIRAKHLRVPREDQAGQAELTYGPHRQYAGA